ncbi:MAG: hypothetical protein CHKLHMKO_00370 [Candidatus Argoarchaeum ethanivorans]|uniref:Uncharacterized protein n=1 Tax=Candidatus Argoarchaeum ethanivorans TaxID=2608793 RepID=A0A811TAZ3_9EURY|nr:MAG: hypothetical protein CHKLHMKO_00370 [Candidatus Argoarchaeum ethanivorans]
MKICEVLIERGICEVYFRYTTKLEGYATLMSDINELYEIRLGELTNNLKTNEIIL